MSEGLDPTDPRRLDVLAVTTDDAVTALEASVRRDSDVVFRATPPFHGRMRARLHRRSVETAGPGDPVVVAPADLFGAVPPYPDVDETAADVPPEDAFSERHRERHVAAVAAWREAVRDARVDAVSVPSDGGPHAVRIAWLG